MNKYINTGKLTDYHQTSIEILEGIDRFQNLVRLNYEHIRVLNRNFPHLIKKYKHNIEIYDMCIERLKQRYNNLKNIKNE
jgi:hypothetical protein